MRILELRNYARAKRIVDNAKEGTQIPESVAALVFGVVEEIARRREEGN